MPITHRPSTRVFLVTGTLVLVSLTGLGPAIALDKYGRPLPALGTSETGTPERAARQWLRGYLLTAVFADNPTFVARPDNTGLVGLRHMVHLETDLYEDLIQFYTDQNVFSDRRRGWIELSEWDTTFALTGSINQWGWRLQYERDAPLDRSGIKQIYADGVVTYRFAQANRSAQWRRRFPDQNLSVYVGGGWLFHNESYFARPDNTGRALFRYLAHADLDLYRNRLVLFVDTNWFSDRSRRDKITPTELDWIVGLAFRWNEYELAVLHERDLPLDRGGLVQRYTAIQLRYEFEWQRR